MYPLLQTATGCISQQSGKYKIIVRSPKRTLNYPGMSQRNHIETGSSPAFHAVRLEASRPTPWYEGAKFGEEWKASPLSSLIDKEEEAPVPWMWTVGAK